LQELVDPSNFKSYDELKTKLYRVLALDGGPQVSTATVEQEIVDEPVPQVNPVNAGDDDDESLAFFKKLAED
jgi:riboflavin biosynthesis pyrimidine reductase